MIKKEEEGDEDVTLLLRIDFSVQDSQQVVDIILCVRSRFFVLYANYAAMLM